MKRDPKEREPVRFGRRGPAEGRLKPGEDPHLTSFVWQHISTAGQNIHVYNALLRTGPPGWR